MRKHRFFLITIALVALLGCKKENVIRHELSGVWEIQKSEVSYYTNGELDSVAVLKDVGSINLQDLAEAKEFNVCYFDLVPDYIPRGLDWELMFDGSTTSCHWISDSRDRDRVTFWNSKGFLGETIHVVYNRIKNANGPGRKEQWMYVRLDTAGNILDKEVLYLKLKETTGKIIW